MIFQMKNGKSASVGSFLQAMFPAGCDGPAFFLKTGDRGKNGLKAPPGRDHTPHYPHFLQLLSEIPPSPSLWGLCFVNSLSDQGFNRS